jgi:hypothetical protein
MVLRNPEAQIRYPLDLVAASWFHDVELLSSHQLGALPSDEKTPFLNWRVRH